MKSWHMRASWTRAALLGSACLGVCGASVQGQNIVQNPSFEEINAPGSDFVWSDWLNFGNIFVFDGAFPAFEGGIAAKMFGGFFYQFPWGLGGDGGFPAGFPLDEFPTFDLDGDTVDDCCDTVPANNPALLQRILDGDGNPVAPEPGSTVEFKWHYYQEGGDEPVGPGAFILVFLAFQEEVSPGQFQDVGQLRTVAEHYNLASDEWHEISAQGVVPDGTDAMEIVVLHFQYAGEYSPIDADGDGIQDTDPNSGFPAFDIVTWAGGASHYDQFEVTITPPADCPVDFNDDGVLNFFDVSEFLQLFNAQDPAADLNDDDVWNFFDVSEFLQLFNAGC